MEPVQLLQQKTERFSVELRKGNWDDDVTRRPLCGVDKLVPPQRGINFTSLYDQIALDRKAYDNQSMLVTCVFT